MNIWLVQIGETLPLKSDVRKLRTAVLADKLIEQGHSVLWWASSFDHLQKKWVTKRDDEFRLSDSYVIKTLKGSGYKRNVSLCRFVDHRKIANKFKKHALSEKQPDVIIASMPSHDLAYEVVQYAHRNNIPVIIDIRDPWPDIFLSHVPPFLHKIALKLLKHDFTMVTECMKKADALTSMMNSLLTWGLRYAERKKSWKDEVFYLGYKKTAVKNTSNNKIVPMLDQLSGKFIVIFIGTFAAYHNPTILLDVAERLSSLNILFVLAGQGELSNIIHRRASGMKNVILPGWLNQDEISLLLKNGNVGVCPTEKNSEFLPNKAFAYLSEGLPIVSAFEGDLRIIMSDRNIGLFYPPNDIYALSNCIRQLYEQKDLYETMRRNAQLTFCEIGDADLIYEKYVQHIEKIVMYKNGGSKEWN
jgi:glycosyltransferase involved in cell wall biosynthesis